MVVSLLGKAVEVGAAVKEKVREAAVLDKPPEIVWTSAAFPESLNDLLYIGDCAVTKPMACNDARSCKMSGHASRK